MTIKTLNNEQLAYIAGFIDGEGYISLTKRKHFNKIGDWIGISAVIVISNTHKQVLKYIKRICGVSSKIYDNPQKGNRRLAYRLVFNSKEATCLLIRILPYLIVKKRQAKVFINFKETNKHNAIRRNKLWEKMRFLNRVGLLNA